MIICILLMGIVTAFNPFENLENYFKLKYDNVSVIGNSSKYKMESNHTAVDILIDGEDYTVFMSNDNYDNAVIVSYKLEANINSNEREIGRLKPRVRTLEDKLNITDVTQPEPPEAEVILYSCSHKESRECLGGLSGLNKNNVSTRCYNIFKIGWSTCSTGWELQ